MLLRYYPYVVVWALLSLLSACANIVPPTGGEVDHGAPRLLAIKPGDSLLNTRLTRLELRFDEFVTVSDVAKEVQISPALSQNPALTAKNRIVILTIADSLLEANTTYAISLGKAIKDIHESNPYTAKPILFSTGSWFDSLTLEGEVWDALTGLKDSSGNVTLLLYDARDSFDIVYRKKPLYMARSGTQGNFKITGLPDKPFRLFALKEKDASMKLDDYEELVAFSDSIYHPVPDSQSHIKLVLFKEEPDSAVLAAKMQETDAAPAKKSKLKIGAVSKEKEPQLDAKTFTYVLKVDTSNTEKRTQDVRTPLYLYSSRPIKNFDKSRIHLSFDSSGVELEAPLRLISDTSGKKISFVVDWKENTLYELRILKDFLQDSAETYSMPSKYSFRTKSEKDYAILRIRLPLTYRDSAYVLQVENDEGPVYRKAIAQKEIKLEWLNPGNYTVKIIKDDNGDGEWTTGNLRKQRQAEQVIPYEGGGIMLKASWENIIDFDTKSK